ncbi:hypothetical protein [Frateuria soli]|uniref:hypothetical protein n=1 Tax=Frateuria soli TaxID=1542730 RepID=UPI001E3CA34D|nr:hypothetical protein [Frateuria soli]UGB37246.1 hypothetical protein LQ771_10425 [Frateuria soli]
MTKKQKFWTAYFSIAFLFALYSNIWGETHYKSFAYNLGRGVVWPLAMFPAFGHFVGAILLVIGVLALLAFGRSRNY